MNERDRTRTVIWCSMMSAWGVATALTLVALAATGCESARTRPASGGGGAATSSTTPSPARDDQMRGASLGGETIRVTYDNVTMGNTVDTIHEFNETVAQWEARVEADLTQAMKDVPVPNPYALNPHPSPHRWFGLEYQSGGVWQNWVETDCLITFEHDTIIGSLSTWKRQFIDQMRVSFTAHPPDLNSAGLRVAPPPAARAIRRAA